MTVIMLFFLGSAFILALFDKPTAFFWFLFVLMLCLAAIERFI
jgi:hypothetical protein